MNRRRVEANIRKGWQDKIELDHNADEVWDHIQNARIELEDIVMNNMSSRILTPWQRLVFWVMYEVVEYLHDKNAQIIHDAIEAAKSREGESCQ